MDKARDVRSGLLSRFSVGKPHSKQPAGLGGRAVATEKLKKERLKKLSALGRVARSSEDCRMDCFKYDEDEHLRRRAPSLASSGKKFELPRKLYADEDNSVDHSIPRKLRSGTKKRSHESSSPPLPDLKKLHHSNNGFESPRKSIIKKSETNTKRGNPLMPITEDEEEVVETLYALAGMVPINDRAGHGEDVPEVKLSASIEPEQHPAPAAEVPKDESDHPSTMVEAVDPSSSSAQKSPPGETLTVLPLNEPCIPPQFNLASDNKFETESTLVPQMSLQPALWPGLSCPVSHGDGIHSPPLQFTSTKIPAWLDAAICATGHGSSKSGASEKVSKTRFDKKSWKKCAAHIHISHFIRIQQISYTQNPLQSKLKEFRPDEELRQGVQVTGNDPRRMVNGLSEVHFATSDSGSSAEKRLKDARNCNLQQWLHQHHRQFPPAPVAFHASQKQNFNFLSLAAGSGGMEAGPSSNRGGKIVEPPLHFPVSYMNSLAKSQSLVAISLPQSNYTQQPTEPSPYLGGMFCSPASSTSSTRQHQGIWVAPSIQQVNSAVMPRFPSWQNGRQSLISLTQHTQLSSPLSLEAIGPNHMPIAPSWASPRERSQQHLPSDSGARRNGYESDGPATLQLLCHEHL